MKGITNEQLFLMVVEAGSFKRAAESLDMDPSIVSRRVANLEKRLGVKLIERSTRQSLPSEAGQHYFAGLKTLLEEQQALESQICGTVNTPLGHLKVAAPHDFGCEFVIAVLEKMAERYPQLSVELVLGSHYENLKSQNIDVAVRIGELADSSLICRRIGQVPRVLVASKGYLKKRGVPESVAALAGHDFVFYARSQIDGLLNVGAQSVRVKGRFVVNSVSAIKQLVLNDKGIHHGPVWAFSKELREGSLVKVLVDEPLKSYPLHVLYVSRNYLPAKIRVFIDTLIECIGRDGFE
ncbi:LysR family transcriptional regulator [Aliagarivorans marinus]|uniref:LysR family transcriptional regulator n=1 Tax=Aliagarivorans marinus TaxID=561965 RepID=UPI0003FDCF77|nr:LysR family transcriptional regulator [Aliagarivorans marinus]